MRGRGEGTYYMDGDLFAWRMKIGERSLVRKAATQKELRAKVKTALRELDERGRTLEPKERGLTVAAYLEEWLAVSVRPNRAKSTYRQYEQVVRLYVLPHLGARPLAKIGDADVQRLLNALKEPDEKAGRSALSDASRAAVRAILKRAFGLAVKRRLLLYNPVDATERPRPASRRARAMSPEEAARFLARTDGGAGSYAPLAAFLVSTGLRIGEALGLRWQDVDGDALNLAAQMEWEGGTWSLEALKTPAARRRVPLNPVALRALERQRAAEGARSPAASRHGLVFAAATGEPMKERNVYRALEALCKDAGVSRYSAHDLRRTFGTLLANSAVPMHVLKALLGHESLETTVEHYLFASSDDKGAAVAKLILPSLDKMHINGIQ